MIITIILNIILNIIINISSVIIIFTIGKIIIVFIFCVRILAGDYRPSDRCGAIIELLLLQIKYKSDAEYFGNLIL